ncbi:MAG: E3 ubiquitin-protein ligase RNF181-like protein [Terrestrivirus sp.]|uniref:E3 ubiquitin-protein ligase RNF181-like protein n=1 Tax=Terrestrivirus sp. TaxID=2487775 RepID=A0A3G4ZK64_9VIRU|nr:MAG: E3 ubiquitin-protein ligase RNF181-like protein [Terrestrivirus sp.]
MNIEIECENDCPVCLDTLNEPVYDTACKHQFHMKCILVWVNTMEQKNKSCPICRHPLSQYSIQETYKKMFPKNNAEEKLDCESFMKLPGVKKFKNDMVILDLDEDTWIPAFGKALTIAKGSEIMVNISQYHARSIMRLYGNDIFFKTPFVKYYIQSFSDQKFLMNKEIMNDYYKFRLQIDDKNLLEKLQKFNMILLKTIKSSFSGNVDYKDFLITKSPNKYTEGNEDKHFVHCRTKTDVSVFSEMKPISIKNISSTGTGRFMIKIKIVDVNKVLYLMNEIVQCDIQKNEDEINSTLKNYFSQFE